MSPEDDDRPKSPASAEPVDGAPDNDHYVLRLYVTGSTPRSSRAIENMRSICEEKLRGHYDLEIVDIYQNPEVARDAQIIAAPTLLKVLPLPLRRIIGDLSDSDKVLTGLSLHSRSSTDSE